jgi:hypothetical protein
MPALKITHTLARVHTNTQALRSSHFAKSYCTAQNPAPLASDGCKNSATAGGGGLQASWKV